MTSKSVSHTSDLVPYQVSTPDVEFMIKPELGVSQNYSRVIGIWSWLDPLIDCPLFCVSVFTPMKLAVKVGVRVKYW